MNTPHPSNLVVFALFSLMLVGCSGADEPGMRSPPPSCVENLNVDCKAVQYPESNYATIYRELIQPQCALGSSCHGTDSAMGGLVLTNADDTYDALLGTKGGTKRVLPGDAACSPLMVRLESRDPNFQMPRGNRLSEAALCNFIQWIEQGAPKN
jgi:hypothetical protein